MTNRTVAAVFDRYEDAAAAVRNLENAGVAHGDISVVSNDATQRTRYETNPDTAGNYDTAATGAGTGATVGTAVGAGAGLLAGLGLLAIPGLGPVVAVGWLASTLLGAGAGAAAGGILGSLTGAGIDETDAHTYAEAIHRGGTLVTVRTNDANHDRALAILDTNGTVDLGQREAKWRADGWTGQYAGTSGTTPSFSTASELGLTTGGSGQYSTGSPTSTGASSLTPRPRVRSYPL